MNKADKTSCLSAKLLDRWFGDIDSSRIDLECGMVEFAKDALAFLGRKQVSLDSLKLNDYSLGCAKAVKATDKGDVLVQVHDWPCEGNKPEWLHMDVLSLGDMCRVCAYVNFLVQVRGKNEKAGKR